MNAMHRRMYPQIAIAILLTCCNSAFAFYNPHVGRWVSRDPIGERGGLNVMGYCHNDGIGRIDPLGKDYYIVTTEGACGVKHRVMIGDDGNGGYFMIDFVPVVDHWWQSLRRFCGKGRISVTPGRGSAADAVGNLYDIEKRAETTAETDKKIAAAAASLDKKEMTYCLLIRDCRAIENCVLEQTLAKLIADTIQKAVDDALKSFLP